MNEDERSRETLAKRIAGEIVLSPSPGDTIQKWRSIFKISQRKLAEAMGVMPSVISDYESGRRKSPGVTMIKKMVTSLLEIDENNGGQVIKEFNSLNSKETLNDAIVDIKELTKPKTIKDFADILEGEIVVGKDKEMKPISGYTIIDSLKAIVELPPSEFVRLYGLTTERAMVFTKTGHGRSPLIAMKVTNLKPGVVVLHGMKDTDSFDKLARRIAEVENLPIIISRIDSVENLVTRLRSFS